MLRDVAGGGKINSQKTVLTFSGIIIFTNDKESICIGISALMSYAFQHNININEIETCDKENYNSIITSILNKFLKLLKKNDNHYKFLIAWSVAWIYNKDSTRHDIKINDELVCELLNIWLYSDEYNLKRMSGWSLNQVFSAKKDILNYINTIEYIEDRILDKYHKSDNEYDKYLAVYIGTEIGIKWDKEELDILFNNEDKRQRNDNFLFNFYAEKLGIEIKEKEETIPF